MKNIPLLILLCVLGSCQKYACGPRELDDVWVKSPHPMTDSVAKIIGYKKGSNFLNAGGPVYRQLIKTKDTNYSYGAPSAIFGWHFSDDSDYVIELLPSGRTHRITELKYGHQKDRRVGYCSYLYSLDGRPAGENWEEKETFTNANAHPIELD